MEDEKRHPKFEEEESVGLVCEPAVGAMNAFTTYDDGGMAYDDDIASDEDLEKLDWDKFPSLGPFSEEEAIVRIDKFEEELAKGEVKWIRIDDIHAELKKRHPWL